MDPFLGYQHKILAFGVLRSENITCETGIGNKNGVASCIVIYIRRSDVLVKCHSWNHDRRNVMMETPPSMSWWSTVDCDKVII